MDPPRRPSLPPPATIRDYYDEHVRALGGDYIAQRWQGGEVQRRHYRQTRAALDALLAGAPLGDVLEVGCGPAVWTELLVGRAARVELLDISSEMLAQARRRVAAWDQGRFAAQVTYRHGDFLTTAVAPASFDTLLSLRALEYVSDKPEFLARCFAVLRTGGRLLLGTKNDDWYDAARARRRAGHQRRSFAAAMQSDLVSARVLGEMVARAGFQDVAVLPLVVGSYHRPFRWRLGLATCDRLHRGLRGRPVQPWWSALVESVIAVARRRL